VVFAALAMPAALAASGGSAAPETESAQTPTIQKVDLGDYEVVYPWPKPLPDDDLSHDGWTWGSGSGVWAESVDKVWVGQRGEIELPPGAPPWIYASLLDPPRTNTGRRPYAGENRDYDIRRHHIIFAVDREANTIEAWLWRTSPGEKHGTRGGRPRPA
jgi:hypothetical protein